METLLANFDKVISSFTVQIVEKNIEPIKPILKEISVKEEEKEVKEEPKARKNFPIVVKLNPFKESEEKKFQTSQIP